MVVKQMKKDIERESYEEWVWLSSVRLSFLDEDAKREWNHGHQNRRIVVKARNVLCSLVERERPIYLFDFLSFEHVIHTIEEKQEIRALTERINLKRS